MIKINIAHKDYNEEYKYFPLAISGKAKWKLFGFNSVISCGDVM